MSNARNTGESVIWYATVVRRVAGELEAENWRRGSARVVAQDPTLYAEQAQKNCRVWSEIARTLNARRAMLGKKQVVLFHCFGGILRSPAALAATLMAREGLQAQEATGMDPLVIPSYNLGQVRL